MRFLASLRVRLFLVSWALFSVHFATNVVREHYPAFAFVDHGDFFLDEYKDLHADLFLGPKGRWVTGNQVAGSLPAVPGLLLFDPLLDALEQRSKDRLASGEGAAARYQTDRPNRVEFFRRLRERGLELRFGAATFVTSAFCMAPLSAAMVVLIFSILRTRAVREPRAAALALLFGFGTPLFYRTAHLVHNEFLMIVVFVAFWWLWPRSGEERVPARRVAGAGFLAGWSVALDYAGFVPLGMLYLYLAIPRWRALGLRAAFSESLPFLLASLPPVLFLLATQEWMYGDPFLPGQYYMQPNDLTPRGWKGIDLPSFEVFWRNLWDPSWGLYTFGPLLLLGLIPAALYGRPESAWLLPRKERRFVAGFSLAFMLFCAMNQYSLLQWNTGFRYLLVLVPFIFVQVADLLAPVSRRTLLLVSLPAVAHSWVLSMSRFTQPHAQYDGPSVVLECWREILMTGPQLPWLTVLRQVVPDPQHWLHSPLLPSAVLAIALGTCALIWWLGTRAAEGGSRA